MEPRSIPASARLYCTRSQKTAGNAAPERLSRRFPAGTSFAPDRVMRVLFGCLVVCLELGGLILGALHRGPARGAEPFPGAS